MKTPLETPVLIIGGGPIGLALAGDLGRRGIVSVLIERQDGTDILQPKMDLLHARTMEIVRRWGLKDKVHAAGFNRDHSQDYAWVTALTGGWELGREPFPTNAASPPEPQSPEHKERCPQNFFDPVLREFALATGNARLFHSTELVDFEETDSGVLATVRNLVSGETWQVRADYMLGCDGGASPVRTKLGITLSGNALLTNTTNIIFRSDELGPLIEIAPHAYRYIFIGPEGTWATIVCIDGRNTWRFSFVGSADKPALTEAEAADGIRRAVGRDFSFEIISSMQWSRRELTADSYGRGRVWLCGDSAHQLSPTGGFGMTTGIQEAADLAWKLAAVIQGWGGPALLPSYEAERQPVAKRNVTEAAVNLGRMLSTRKQLPPQEMFEHGPAGDAARKAYGEMYTETMKPEWFTLGITMGYRYDNSPIIIPDGTPPPPLEVTTYTQTARPGARAPHVWMGEDKSTIDLFDLDFVLLRIGRANDRSLADVTVLEFAAHAAGVPLRTVDLINDEVADAYERRLILVRPDGHVAWRSDLVPDTAEARRIIDIVRGAGV
ncbi:FAD-dependent monooxygenase [Novosphingobium cyanobacteriorum]|uniref:FAD-dependent monooxygenase n=1 Tax=Novosphingobium cyanobacteriorum TaxID=3024215 RepID=A0ABT6CLV4_9SPHN|nr:FAD-dependent monooxygenase [Novosphingobium cyanobacteriorum]MDF8334904.1 FAD-dependent monooxygenase [Novosphingobium cyanobacteriorum]